MSHVSLYTRLASPAAPAATARTIITKSIETVDNDEEGRLHSTKLLPAARTRVTASKETIDNDSEEMGLSVLVPGSEHAREATAARLLALTASS